MLLPRRLVVEVAVRIVGFFLLEVLTLSLSVTTVLERRVAVVPVAFWTYLPALPTVEAR